MLSVFDWRSSRWRFGLRLSRVAALVVAAAIILLPFGRAQDVGNSRSSATTPLMREGTQVADREAICRSSGERLLVVLEDDASPLIALENLAAQRILKAVLDDAADAQWIVDGQVTEFQDRNYILLERVVRQSKAK